MLLGVLMATMVEGSGLNALEGDKARKVSERLMRRKAMRCNAIRNGEYIISSV